MVDMRLAYWLFAAGAVLFLGGAAAILQGLNAGGDGPAFSPAGLYALIAAAACLAVAAVLVTRRVDWRRVEAEQRLWESGPLGRAWLKIRQKLSGR